MRISHLVNIGTKTALLLNQVGVYTQQDLQHLGPIEVWKRLKRVQPEKTTLKNLYILQGALLGVPWRMLSTEILEQLLAEADTPPLELIRKPVIQ